MGDRERTFGAWLRAQRRASDLTHAELAAQVSCSVSALRRFEANTLRPSRPVAEALGAALQIAPADRAAFVGMARHAPGADPAHLLAPAARSHSPAPPPSAARGNLPAPPTALIGRAGEVQQICALLSAAQARLVTLTGPGGVGKTRVALEVAAALLGAFADGVTFIDLTPIRDPQLVAGAIAEALGVHEMQGQPLLATLKAHLYDKQQLLLLDNFEQVLDAAPLLAVLLAGATQLKVLVTSRAVLRLRGEVEFPVASLALPDRAALPSLDQLAQYGAVALFIARTRDARPGFQLTATNAPAVAEICARLDGLPLAIELAAARGKLFTPEALLARLGSRLALLTCGPRDLPARQQALYTTIDWSYQLLTPAEQRLFRRLAVFVGGWTLEAAEAVCDYAGDLGASVIDGLQALVDHNLVRQSFGPDGAPRFRRLETIGEYAEALLLADPDEPALRHSHARYCTRLAEYVAARRHDIPPSLIDRLVNDYDNLLAALAWSVRTPQQTPIALQLAFSLNLFWSQRGSYSEGMHWIERALALPWDASMRVLRADVLLAAGYFAHGHSAVAVAEQCLAEALQLYELQGDQQSCSEVLGLLGMLYNNNNLALAEAYHQASLRAAQAAGSSFRAAWAMRGLSWARAVQGHLAAAWDLCEAALAIFEERQQALGRAHTLILKGYLQRHSADTTDTVRSLSESQRLFVAELRMWPDSGVFLIPADIARDEGRYAEAEALLTECLAMEQGSGQPSSVTYWALCFLALAHGDTNTVYAYLHEHSAQLRALDRPSCRAAEHLVAGALALTTADYPIAREQYHAYLAGWIAAPDRPSDSPQHSAVMALALTGLAAAYALEATDHRLLTAQLWGAADAPYHTRHAIAFGTTYITIPRLRQAIIQPAQTAARVHVGDAAFDQAWAAGQALTLDVAVALALAAS